MLDVQGLRAGYGTFDVLHGISLRIPEARIVALLGHNGAGKSTLLKAISGQIPIRAGEMAFKGGALVPRSPASTAKLGIRYVPQDANVFPNISIIDNLKIGSYVLKPDAALFEQRLEAVFALFPVLRERRRAQARVLSGGQRQMLAISLALMTAPDVLLLDEPSAGLSPANVQRLFEAIARLRDDFGTSVLLVEQNVNEALRTADSAYVLQEGRIVYEAPAARREEIIQHLWGLHAVERAMGV
jgi:branched-chain amino acid transport system ATP-binding protein